jgi:mannose-6-phosphate isomerase-like protein (cupin superfamily)
MTQFKAHSPAVATVMVDDRNSRVTRWDFEPGAETGFHRHGMAYVVVPITDGTLRIEDAEGTRDVQLSAGVAYTRDAGVEHNVINGGSNHLAFVEVEIKG